MTPTLRLILSGPSIVRPETEDISLKTEMDRSFGAHAGLVMFVPSVLLNLEDLTSNYHHCLMFTIIIVCVSLSGESSYLDFSNPATRAWYSRCFTLDKYKVRLWGAHKKTKVSCTRHGFPSFVPLPSQKVRRQQMTLMFMVGK